MMSTTESVPPSQPQGGLCVCYACGRPVHPNPLTAIQGTLRGYEVTWVVLDDKGSPCLVRYLKCADCLGPKTVRRIERHEARNRIAREARARRAAVPPSPHDTPLPLRRDANP